MELNLYSLKGRKLAKKVQLDDAVFAAKINVPLMELAVRIYRANQRQAGAHTKQRGEVRGGGAKPWRQKGTGRARHGSIRSPIWKGGGVAFGPRKERVYSRKLSKKMKKAAIRSALSSFAKEKKLIILEGVELKDGHLTKQVLELTDKLGVGKKALYLQKGDHKNLYLGSRNLKEINVVGLNEVNVYTLLKHKSLIILQDALEEISKFWGKVPSGKSKERKVVRERTKESKVPRQARAIEELELPTRVVNSLKKEGIETKRELERRIESGSKIKGVGEKSLGEIKKVLNIK